MLQVTDITQTRVYQEALEQGRKEGVEKEREAMALRLLQLGHPVAEIARVTELPIARIRKLSKKNTK